MGRRQPRAIPTNRQPKYGVAALYACSCLGDAWKPEAPNQRQQGDRISDLLRGRPRCAARARFPESARQDLTRGSFLAASEFAQQDASLRSEQRDSRADR